jgi:hypothetical protein
MRVPQVSDRIKEAPAVALRGVLAGVGQLLLITDRLRNKNAQAEDVPQPRTAEPAAESGPGPASEPGSGPASEPASEPPGTAAEAPAPPQARDFDKTGNVRLLTEEDTAPEAAEAPAAAEAAAAPVEAEAPAAAEAPEAPAAAEVPAAPAAPAAELPLPNYDELSVASLRARLRTLTSAQVAELAEYERAHASRTEVITMFERRIAKLEAGG